MMAAPPAQAAAPAKPVKPVKPPAKNHGCGTLIVIVVAVVILAAVFGDHDKKPKDSTPSPTAAAAAADEAKRDEECATDVVCSAKKHAGAAEVYCKPQIEARALHDVKWTDKFLDPMMSRYKWAGDKHDAIVYIGDKVAFQNGFGAYNPMIYLCTVDLASERVTKLEIIEGRLPAD